jgi:hypothetical protein
MARGIGILAPDAETARERFLAEAPDRNVIAVVPLDISDIPLRVPFSEPYWVVAFEDPDPDRFLQDADPIAKATRDVRELLQAMVADPMAMVSGQVEGNVSCPECGETVHLELPPDDLIRRPGFGSFLYTQCPSCHVELMGPKRARPIPWQARPHHYPRSLEPRRDLGRGRGDRRACVFCDAENQKISKEHLWSKWMSAHVEPAGSGPTTKSRIVATKTGRVERSQTWLESAFGQEISGPCKRCNEGWMERIEADARPFLIPMLEDRQVNLGPEAQRAVARWATLKLLVAHLGHPGQEQHFPADRFRTFFIDRSLSANARVWIARYGGAGAWPTDHSYLELSVTEHGGPEPQTPNAYLAGFSVGHLAFFYWGHELPDGPVPDVGRVERYLASVWPATGTVSWPPRDSLDGDGIRFVMDRFPVDRWMVGAGS